MRTLWLQAFRICAQKQEPLTAKIAKGNAKIAKKGIFCDLQHGHQWSAGAEFLLAGFAHITAARRRPRGFLRSWHPSGSRSPEVESLSLRPRRQFFANFAVTSFSCLRLSGTFSARCTSDYSWYQDHHLCSSNPARSTLFAGMPALKATNTRPPEVIHS